MQKKWNPFLSIHERSCCPSWCCLCISATFFLCQLVTMLHLYLPLSPILRIRNLILKFLHTIKILILFMARGGGKWPTRKRRIIFTDTFRDNMAVLGDRNGIVVRRWEVEHAWRAWFHRNCGRTKEKCFNYVERVLLIANSMANRC